MRSVNSRQIEKGEASATCFIPSQNKPRHKWKNGMKQGGEASKHLAKRMLETGTGGIKPTDSIPNGAARVSCRQLHAI